MHLKQPIYLTILGASFLIGLLRWRILNRSEKVIVILLAVTLLQELIAYVSFEVRHNNHFTYHFYSPLEFFLICIYFNFCSAFLARNGAGVWLGVFGVLISIMNTIFFQPLQTFNSYFLLFEGTVIIVLSLLSICEILLAEVIYFDKRPYFWVILTLLFYWSLTYTGWGVFSLVGPQNHSLVKIFNSILYFANLLFYISLAAVFFFYKKINRPEL